MHNESFLRFSNLDEERISSRVHVPIDVPIVVSRAICTMINHLKRTAARWTPAGSSMSVAMGSPGNNRKLGQSGSKDSIGHKLRTIRKISYAGLLLVMSS